MAGIRNYLIVTASYWSFTLTDGALRMLVLLHFYALGYTPFMLASLFLLYETAGIFANLGGGWLATRFGIPRMLAVGLVLQIGGLVLLSALDPGWGIALSVAWAVTAQAFPGSPRTSPRPLPNLRSRRLRRAATGNCSAGWHGSPAPKTQ